MAKIDAARLVAEHFAEPPPAILERLQTLELDQPFQVEALTKLLCNLRLAALPPGILTSHFVYALRSMLVELLPAVKRGVVPGLSFAGRHRRADAWVSASFESSQREPGLVIDLGCGFPPLTTVDLARSLPRARVVGVDARLPAFILEQEDMKALFDSGGELLHAMNERALAGINDPHTREALRRTFLELRGSGEHARGGHRRRLIEDPLSAYALPNLTFEAVELASVNTTGADLARCLNVLVYFTPQQRREAMARIAELVAPGGLVLTGANFVAGSEGRYELHRREDGGLRPVELAFSVDNLRPLGAVTWLEIHEDEAVPRLAQLVSKIRADRGFAQELDRAYEDIARRLGLCEQGDAFDVAPLEPAITGASVAALLEALGQQGFTREAVRILRENAVDAYENAGGDIAVRL